MYHRPHQEASTPPDPPLLPPVEQPRGLSYFFKTWSGRLLTVNAIVFLCEVFYRPGASLNSIPVETLLQFGAKEPVLLAQGEVWRYFLPVFLHGNLLHILFNNWALYVVAFQLEVLLGPRNFLLLYFLAGIGGNIVSAVWGLSLSVGASGALFGLLGCAWYFERTIQKKVEVVTGNRPRTGAYTVMVVANILFGLIIPQIDNAAHIGGLLVGVIFAYVLLRLRPNRLLSLQKTRAGIVLTLAFTLFVAAGAIGASPAYVSWRLERAARDADSMGERYSLLTRRLALPNAEISDVWLHLRLALQLDDLRNAARDIEVLRQDPEFDKKFAELEAEVREQGNSAALEWLKARTLANP